MHRLYTGEKQGYHYSAQSKEAILNFIVKINPTDGKYAASIFNMLPTANISEHDNVILCLAGDIYTVNPSKCH